MQSEMNQKDLFDRPPEWLSKAVIYQIFPDRFRKSGLVESQRYLNLQPWGSEPCQQGFHGGDLYGVIEALDYLEELGVNCIYLTPVFSSAANHRYHTYDYLQVDPILGGNCALENLIDEMHRRGMHIILDGVFNHCSRGFWAFHNLLENGKRSPYLEWFNVHKWPLNPYPKLGEDCGYSCWWNDPALPKFNHDNPQVCEYLLSISSYWLNKGIDGWRLDVPDEVPIGFWKRFRREVKLINSEAWIVGEIWGDARDWLKGEHFDGVMNYRIGWSSLCWSACENLNDIYKNPHYPIENIDSKAFVDILKTTFSWYRPEANQCQMNLLDSHDVPRSLNTLKGDLGSLKLALFLLFLQVGAPCIYYGTEVGLSGGIEPLCREPFPWDKKWNEHLREFIKSLTVLRSTFPGIYKFGLEWTPIGKDGLVGKSTFDINLTNESQTSILVFMNRSRKDWLQIPEHLTKPFFQIGSVDLSRRILGPQSAILIS